MRFDRTLLLACGLAAAVHLGAAPAAAQQPEGTRFVRDYMLGWMIPVPPPGLLPERWRSLGSMPRPGTRDRFDLNDDFLAGLIDPLALVEQIVGSVPVPPGASYHPECSLALGAGFAVYSFGGEATEANVARRAALASAAGGEAALAAHDATHRNDSLPPAQAAALRRADAYLKQNGFRFFRDGGVLQVYVRGRQTGIPFLEASLARMNPYPQCVDYLPSGPLYVVSAGRS